MTETTPDTTAAGPAAGSTAPPGADAGPRPRKAASRRNTLVSAALIVVFVIACALAAALWWGYRTFESSRQSQLEQLQQAAAAAQQASAQASEAEAALAEQSRQISELQRSLKESDGRLRDLAQAFQTISDSGSELQLVNDIDHLATIASQQLALSGNVANAIIALETAQAQLARANRSSLASLQQTINGDLERLRAAQTVDVSLLSSRLDELSRLIAEAPLLVPDHGAGQVEAPAPEPSPETSAEPESSPAAEGAWWERGLQRAGSWSRQAWTSIRHDLGRLVSVRRVDHPEALLMSPEQATQLRQNLHLRIMMAQLALMTHQPKTWHAELTAVQEALRTRYDDHSADSRRAVRLVDQLIDTPVDVPLPTVDNTLQALEALRQARAQDAESEDAPENVTQDSP